MTGADLVKIASSKIGTVEKGGADGKSGNIVEFWDWWKSVTAQNGQGQSWCAVFVSWCFAQIGASSLAAAKNKFGFIYCPDGVNFYKKKNQLVKPEEAQPGDIIFFDWEGKGIADHVGIVKTNNTKVAITKMEKTTTKAKLTPATTARFIPPRYRQPPCDTHSPSFLHGPRRTNGTPSR
jgi:cell wall-associated NlpC family hydrolase